MAVAVALLMIGGEFDLSAGVAVTTSALTASMFSWYITTNVWVGVGLALVVSLAIGFINGWILIKTKLPSFIVTLGHVPDADRPEPGLDQADRRHRVLAVDLATWTASPRPGRSSPPR